MEMILTVYLFLFSPVHLFGMIFFVLLGTVGVCDNAQEDAP